MEDNNYIDVDGTTRPTINSKGHPIHHTEEGIVNFWRWFGDSKVVDNQGRPLVVYHGTNQDVREFEKSKSGEFGAGIYATPHPETANYFGAMKGTDGKNTMTIYLTLKNPLITDDRNVPRSAGVKKLQKKGYDGVIGIQPNGEKQYIVFEPTQIKSATGNSGAFGMNANITAESELKRIQQLLERLL